MWKFPAIASCAFATLASAGNYYVAPGGSDLNAGSQALPWATIQHACETVAVQAGDTILVQPGTYHEKIRILRAGTKGSPITLQADGAVILDGTGIDGENILLLENISYFHVVGFEIRNNLNVNDGSGIRVSGSGTGIELRDNTIHDIRGLDAMGITCYGNASQPLAKIVIDGNLIYDCEPAQSETLVLNGNIDGIKVTNNTIRDVNNIGIVFIGGEGVCRTASKDHARNGVCSGNLVERANSNYGGGYAGGIYVDGAKNILIERNKVTGCDIGIEVGAENRRAVADNIVVRSNLIIENEKAGLAFGGYASNTGKVRNSRFANNTIVNNQNAAETQAELWIQFSDHCIVENNILYSNAEPMLITAEGTQTQNILRNNIYYFNGGAAAATFYWKKMDITGFNAFQSVAKEPGALFADPVFVNILADDYHLGPASPAIDTSSGESYADDGELDFFGKLRQCGKALDRGADEIQAAKPGLAIAGNDIQLDGQNIRLRGVAVGDPILARQGRPLSDYAFLAKDWKANAVRISLHPTVWKHPELYDPRGKDGIVSRLRAEINAAMSAGMIVLLDWHTIGWPDAYFEVPDPEWGDPPDYYDSDFNLAKDFWTRMTDEFGNEGRVIFELWNEPNFSAEEDATVRWAMLKPYWQDLITIIRGKSQNVILVTGSQRAYNLRGIKNDLLPDANTVYAWHIYAGNDFNNEVLWGLALDDLQLTKPVVVSEWGFQSNTTEHFKGTPATFGIKFRDSWLQGKNLHFTASYWHPEVGPPMLRSNWKSTTPYGAFVRTYLRTIAD